MVRRHGRRVLELGTVAALLALAALVVSIALAAPVSSSGSWYDKFSSTDTIPGASLSSGTGVTFGGSPSDGDLRLATIKGTLIQTDWSGGRATGMTTDLGQETRFNSESNNVLFANKAGDAMLVPIVVTQPGLTPQKNPISPLRSTNTMAGYYNYVAFSSQAPLPNKALNTFFYFHRDTTTATTGSLLGFATVSHVAGGGAQASQLTMVLSHPLNAAPVIADDPGELVAGPPGTLTATWTWGNNTDGLALDLLVPTFTIVPRVMAANAVWTSTYTWSAYSAVDANAFPAVPLKAPSALPQPVAERPVFTGALNGFLQSMVFDVGGPAQWGVISTKSTVPPGGSVTAQMMTCPTASCAGISWGSVNNGHRYVRYLIGFKVPDPQLQTAVADPVAILHEVQIPYAVTYEKGHAISTDIAPQAPCFDWSAVDFGTFIAAGAAITVDVLDDQNNLLLSDVKAGQTLTQIAATTYPKLRLQAALTRQVPGGGTPALLNWGLTWNEDSDCDSVPDATDNCVSKANTSQQDTDGDKVGDACDNCIKVKNPDQKDSNNNGVGDACEGGVDAGVVDAAPPDGLVSDGLVPDGVVADGVVTDAVTPDSVVTDSVVTDSVVTDSAVTDSVVTDSAVTDSVVTDSVATDSSVVTDSVVTDSVATDSSVVTDSVVADSAVSDGAVADGTPDSGDPQKDGALSDSADKFDGGVVDSGLDALDSALADGAAPLSDQGTAGDGVTSPVDEGGCDCRTASTAEQQATPGLWLLAALLLVRRRRRRERRG